MKSSSTGDLDATVVGRGDNGTVGHVWYEDGTGASLVEGLPSLRAPARGAHAPRVRGHGPQGVSGTPPFITPRTPCTTTRMSVLGSPSRATMSAK